MARDVTRRHSRSTLFNFEALLRCSFASLLTRPMIRQDAEGIQTKVHEEQVRVAKGL